MKRQGTYRSADVDADSTTGTSLDCRRKLALSPKTTTPFAGSRSIHILPSAAYNIRQPHHAAVYSTANVSMHTPGCFPARLTSYTATPFGGCHSRYPLSFGASVGACICYDGAMGRGSIQSCDSSATPFSGRRYVVTLSLGVQRLTLVLGIDSVGTISGGWMVAGEGCRGEQWQWHRERVRSTR